MKLDPLLFKAFRISLFYGIGALLYFHFFGDAGETWADKGIRAAATAGIFLLLYYVTARVLRGRSE